MEEGLQLVGEGVQLQEVGKNEIRFGILEYPLRVSEAAPTMISCNIRVCTSTRTIIRVCTCTIIRVCTCTIIRVCTCTIIRVYCQTFISVVT